MLAGGVRQRACERGVAWLERLRERPTREIVLVEGDHSRPALLEAAHP